MGTWWQILLSGVGAVLAAFIAGAYGVRSARKQPFEVLQALLKVAEDSSSVLTPADRAVLEDAVHREVQRIDQLNKARRQGFWAFQREKVRLALQLPARGTRLSSFGLLLLAVVASAFLVAQITAYEWRDIFVEGGIGVVLESNRAALALLVASSGVVLWSFTRLALPAVCALLRWIHVLPVYMLATAITVMVYVPLAQLLPSFRLGLIILVALPLLIAVTMWIWLRMELPLLVRYRSRRLARRRLRGRLARRRAAVTSTSATMTLMSLALVAVFMGMGVSTAVTRDEETSAEGYLVWNGYQAVVGREYQWIGQAERGNGAATPAPMTLVYEVRYRTFTKPGRWSDDAELRFLTTAAELVADERGLYLVQNAGRHDRYATGFMICASPQPGAKCSPWQRL
ncbi:hypothetical protein AB0H76_18030 [Nocardia sp. NPDC050712]|uniref:hypothetical protein n=1 Tax=Nocardia sp. NPDC050712 TaxID=3155518 RepID=UPI0033F9AEBF